MILATSCHDQAPQAPVELQASYGGGDHSFQSAQGMYIYQSAGYSVVQGVDTLLHDSLSVAFIGTNVGTYPVGRGYNSSITLKRNAVRYTTQNNVSHGTIVISRLDPVSQRATGTFAATLVNAAAPHDSLVLTSGSIYVTYQ